VRGGSRRTQADHPRDQPDRPRHSRLATSSPAKRRLPLAPGLGSLGSCYDGEPSVIVRYYSTLFKTQKKQKRGSARRDPSTRERASEEILDAAAACSTGSATRADHDGDLPKSRPAVGTVTNTSRSRGPHSSASGALSRRLRAEVDAPSPSRCQIVRSSRADGRRHSATSTGREPGYRVLWLEGQNTPALRERGRGRRVGDMCALFARLLPEVSTGGDARSHARACTWCPV